jgi:hypothetical protein
VANHWRVAPAGGPQRWGKWGEKGSYGRLGPFYRRRVVEQVALGPHVDVNGRRLTRPAGTRRAPGAHEFPCPGVTDAWASINLNDGSVMFLWAALFTRSGPLR